MNRRGVVTVVFVVAVCLLAFGAFSAAAAEGIGTRNETEPNDHQHSATPVTDGSTGNITMSDAGTLDEDWFSFEAKKGEAVRIVYSGRVNYTLYRPDGTVEDVRLSGPGEGGVDTMGLVANRTGTYHIRVINASYSTLSPDSPVSYSFVVARAQPDSFEPNERREDAVSLGSGDHRNATIFEGDTDWFAIDAKKGQNVAAKLRYRSSLPTYGMNVRVDLFDGDGTRIGSRDDGSVVNRTLVTAASHRQTATQSATADRTGTYYVRVRSLRYSSDFAGGAKLDGFTAYSLTATANGTPTEGATGPGTGASNAPDSLVVVGGTPDDKVTYAFTYDGTVKRSGTGHGAPIDDEDVTVDPDIDEITGSRVDGRVGGGGDAYLVTGDITGLRIDGNATAYLDGHAVDPTSFGSVPNRQTATPTSTPTTTETPTSTATPTATRTPTATPTRTATETATQTETSTATTTATRTTSPTPTSTASSTATRTSTQPSGTSTNTTTSNGRLLNDSGSGNNGGSGSSGSNGPGFGIVVSLVALLVTGTLVARRER